MNNLFLSAAFAAAMTAGAVSASTIEVNTRPGQGVFGNANLYQNVQIDLSQGALANSNFDGATVSAGQMALTSPEIGDFLAFCVDLAQFLDLPDEYEMNPMLFGSPIIDNIEALYNTAYSTVDTAVEAAAFQVSLWEIIYDEAGPFDFAAGAFQIIGSAAVVTQADAYLANLAGPALDDWDLTFLASDEGQDLVLANVPVPAAGLLMLGGLGAFAATRRKRKS